MPPVERMSVLRPAIGAWLAATCLLCPSVEAVPLSVAFVQQVRTGYAVQTGDGNRLTGQGYDLSMNVALVPGHGFEQLAWHVPGGEQIDLSIDGVGLGFYYASARFGSLAEMDQRFGAGPYLHDLTGPGNAAQVTLTASVGPYPDAMPYLAGTTYSELQGMDPSRPFDVHLSPIGSGPPGTARSFTFFVDDVLTGTTVFAAGGAVDPAFDLLTVPANLLRTGRSYEFQFYVGNRIEPPTAGTVDGGSQGLVYLTTGNFTTAVPEPASLVSMLGGLAVLIGAARRGRPAG